MKSPFKSQSKIVLPLCLLAVSAHFVGCAEPEAPEAEEETAELSEKSHSIVSLKGEGTMALGRSGVREGSQKTDWMLIARQSRSENADGEKDVEIGSLKCAGEDKISSDAENIDRSIESEEIKGALDAIYKGGFSISYQEVPQGSDLMKDGMSFLNMTVNKTSEGSSFNFITQSIAETNGSYIQISKFVDEDEKDIITFEKLEEYFLDRCKNVREISATGAGDAGGAATTTPTATTSTATTTSSTTTTPTTTTATSPTIRTLTYTVSGEDNLQYIILSAFPKPLVLTKSESSLQVDLAATQCEEGSQVDSNFTMDPALQLKIDAVFLNNFEVSYSCEPAVSAGMFSTEIRESLSNQSISTSTLRCALAEVSQITQVSSIPTNGTDAVVITLEELKDLHTAVCTAPSVQ